MDDLISSLQSFAISNDEKIFEESLNDMVIKMSNLSSSDPNKEWTDLTTNYSKLKYLKNLIHSFNVLPNFFITPFDIFMRDIDKMSQYYLKEIDWYHSEHLLHGDCIDIQRYLEESLNSNNSTEKLNIILKAYDILILIAEDCRRESYKYTLSDKDFLNTFKKRRL